MDRHQRECDPTEISSVYCRNSLHVETKRSQLPIKLSDEKEQRHIKSKRQIVWKEFTQNMVLYLHLNMNLCDVLESHFQQEVEAQT